MLSRRLATARPFLSRQLPRPIPRQVPLLTQTRSQTQARSLIDAESQTESESLTPAERLAQAEIDDPDMNGGYINPPRENRQFRDPYGDWWDKQERRNFGEPVHEDNDILGMLSPEEHTHVTPGKAAFQLGCFVAAILTLCGLTSIFYPDQPSATRTFPDGLSRELGGPGALLAPSDDEV